MGMSIPSGWMEPAVKVLTARNRYMTGRDIMLRLGNCSLRLYYPSAVLMYAGVAMKPV